MGRRTAAAAAPQHRWRPAGLPLAAAAAVAAELQAGALALPVAAAARAAQLEAARATARGGGAVGAAAAAGGRVAAEGLLRLGAGVGRPCARQRVRRELEQAQHRRGGAEPSTVARAPGGSARQAGSTRKPRLGLRSTRLNGCKAGTGACRKWVPKRSWPEARLAAAGAPSSYSQPGRQRKACAIRAGAPTAPDGPQTGERPRQRHAHRHRRLSQRRLRARTIAGCGAHTFCLYVHAPQPHGCLKLEGLGAPGCIRGRAAAQYPPASQSGSTGQAGLLTSCGAPGRASHMMVSSRAAATAAACRVSWVCVGNSGVAWPSSQCGEDWRSGGGSGGHVTWGERLGRPAHQAPLHPPALAQQLPAAQ